MGIQEERLNDWSNIKLSFKANKYPQPLKKDAPRMYFVSLWVGSRGAGKTHSLCKLLKMYESFGIMNSEGTHKVDQRIILFSPTSAANPVYTSLKWLDPDDIIHEYSDEELVDIIDDIKLERQETEEYQRKLKLYKRFLSCRDPSKMDPDDILELDTMGFEPPKEPRYPNGCVCFMILDDLIGSSAFKSTGRSALTNLVLKNRHLGVNILVATQNLKAIPKSIRTNTSLFVIFKFASKKIVCDDLWEEVSNTLTLERFEEAYEHATKEDHDAFVIDFSQPKERRFKKNFDVVLKLI